MLFLLLACTSPATKFSGIWKDETYQARPEKILVISAFGGPSPRRVIEDELVRAFKNRGIDAAVSYTFLPEIPAPILVDKNAIVVQTKAAGADTVLVNRPLERERRDIWVSADGTDMYTLYVNTRTDIYDIKSSRMIMSITAETRIDEKKPYTDQIQLYINDIVNMLSQHKLF
jgi:hypothetical protein